MPPKRPAAAPGRVRDRGRDRGAGAKAAPRGRRRPAAVVDPAEGERDTEVKKFEGGELVTPSTLPSLVWTRGLFVAFEGSYWHSACSVAGEVVGFKDEEGFPVVELIAKGTNSERLLKWATGASGVPLRIHLCHRDCGGDPTADDLFHGKLVKVVKTEEKLPWMGSLEVVHQDELPDLREAVVPKGAPTGGRGAEKEGSDSSSSGKEKKKKKKKEKKEKKKKKEKKEERRAEGSKEGRPQTAGGRFLLKGQKELSAVFGGTGLDPSPAVRRRIRRKARKAARRSSRRSSSTSGSSSSSSEESDMSQEGLFPETKKVKGMAKRSPGALSNQTIEEMKESLLTMSGQMWHMEHDSPAPPLVLHYFRTVLRPKMSGGLAREALTLAFVVDLALQGRIAEAVDTALQRVKSLELSANGTDFRVSQRIELAPAEGEAVTSPTERREALSEAKDEAKLRYQSGKGGDWWKGDSWKKHEWDRKGKKGDPKGNKGDGKKGEKGTDEKGGKKKEQDKK